MGCAVSTSRSESSTSSRSTSATTSPIACRVSPVRLLIGDVLNHALHEPLDFGVHVAKLFPTHLAELFDHSAGALIALAVPFPP
jgi:hypothetical protein